MTQTLGQKLKQAREEQRLTLEKASEATRIRAPYLQALEADDLSAMPAPVQARGFLRNYAEYLGLNIGQLLDELRAEPKPLDEIIGPGDLSDLSVGQTPGLALSEVEVPAQEATALSQLEPDSTSQTQSQLEATPEKPKRRGRKKVEPEPVVEIQPEVIEEPVALSEQEPIAEAFVESQPEEIVLQPDVAENLWQTWLNRLSSVISTRAKPTTQEPTMESDSLLSDVQEQTPALQSLESTQIFQEIGAELRKGTGRSTR